MPVFETEKGRKVYSDVLSAINEYDMLSSLKKGVLLGLSGGADSVMLFYVLIKLKKEHNFNLACVHINHMIRGDEALRDELFAKKLCEENGVEFIAKRIDVPTLATELGVGLEEAARIARYQEFDDIIKGRMDLSTIAVAHNATDNLETIIFNLTRGAGTRGLSGIAPKRDNIIRPLIFCSKSDILAALASVEIPYVFDSTNLSNDYTRNFIRNQILPKLSAISDDIDAKARRVSKNLRCDDDYIISVANAFLKEKSTNGTVKTTDLRGLHGAVLTRVLNIMQSMHTDKSLEQTHISKIAKLLITKNDFSYFLPGKTVFVCRGQFCHIAKRDEPKEPLPFHFKLDTGINHIPELGIAVCLGECNFSSLNVYKKSTQQTFNSAIIGSVLSVRSRIDGDICRYGGMTHKLKRILSDKKIPQDLRDRIPLICDENGVIWAPGIAKRAEKVKSCEDLTITLYYNDDSLIYVPEST